VPVLNGIDLDITKGDFVTVMGPSGCGKSTLLNIIGTLDRPDSGSLKINGENVSEFSDLKISRFRNDHIGFVFQFHHLLPEFTAEENILIPARINGTQQTDRAEELLEYFGLVERRNHYPSQLSGGERQRVALCRALINKPALLLADEPTGNLDTQNAEKLIQYLNRIREDFDQCILVTTHNPDVAKVGNIQLILENETLATNQYLKTN